MLGILEWRESARTEYRRERPALLRIHGKRNADGVSSVRYTKRVATSTSRSYGAIQDTPTTSLIDRHRSSTRLRSPATHPVRTFRTSSPTIFKHVFASVAFPFSRIVKLRMELKLIISDTFVCGNLGDVCV